HRLLARPAFSSQVIGKRSSPGRSPLGVSRRVEVPSPPLMQQHLALPPGTSPSSAAGARHREKVWSWSSVMSRMVSVYLPHLPLERLKRAGKDLPDDRPFALVGSGECGLLLSAVNGASAAQGLVPGMGLADARAICPHLLTAPTEPRKDVEALLALADWASL